MENDTSGCKETPPVPAENPREIETRKLTRDRADVKNENRYDTQQHTARQPPNSSEATAEKLQQSEQKYRVLINLIPDIIYTIDPDGYFTFISPAVKILGYTPGELIGKHFGILIHPEDLETVSRSSVLKKFKGRITGEKKAPKLFDERRRGHRMTRHLEVRLIAKHWDLSSCHASGSLNELQRIGDIISLGLYDDTNQFTGTIGVIRDVTDRKRAQEEAIKLEQQLLQAKKMQAIGQLTSGVAHDFNNLLVPIIAEAQIAEAEVKGSCDPGDLLISIQTILKTAKIAQELTGQMLSFARDKKYCPTALRLDAMITDICSITGSAGHVVNTRFHAKRQIFADKIQVRQAISNLCINACDAMPGGGTLTITTEDVTVKTPVIDRFFTIPPGEYVCITVADTGSGIDEKTMKKIFEPFFTTKPARKGTGLGLAVVYSIIQRHHAFLSVASTPGSGTRITLYFPAAMEASESPAENKIPESRTELLFVDDDKNILSSIEHLFSSTEYIIYTAQNGADALALLERKKIDSIIADLFMQPMSGTELFGRVRRLYPQKSFFIMTGYPQDPQVKELCKAGVDGLLGKPLELSEMLNKLGLPLQPRHDPLRISVRDAIE